MAGHEHTLLVGAGHGGLASFYAAVSSTTTSDNGSGKAAVKRKVFGFAGCISPSFWAGLDSLLCSPSISSPFLWETHNNELPLERSYLMHKVAQHLGERTARQNQEGQEDLEQEEKWKPKLWIDCGLEREDTWRPNMSSSSSSSLEQLTARRATHMAEILQRRYGYHIGRDLFVFEDDDNNQNARNHHHHHHNNNNDDDDDHDDEDDCWGHNRLGLCILTFLLHQSRPPPSCGHRVDQEFNL